MSFKLLFSLITLLLLSACASAPAYQEKTPAAKHINKPSISLDHMDPQFLYLAAQQAIQRGQQGLAAKFLAVLVQKKPEDIEPRLALVELHLGYRQGSVKTAKALIEGMPEASVAALEGENLARYQLLSARTLLANGDVEAASSLLAGLLKQQPSNTQIRLLLVRLQHARQAFKQAHHLLQQGLVIKESLQLRQMQVQLYLQQNQEKKADKSLAEIQVKYPDHEDVVLQRSQLAEKQNNLGKAEKLLKQYIDLHKETAVQSYLALAALYVRQERLQDALAVYKTTLPYTAGAADVYVLLGKTYYQLGEYVEASQVFKQAMAQLPTGHAQQVENQQASEEQALVWFYLAASLEASHRWAEAVPYYTRIKPNHRRYLDAQLRLANIEVVNKQFAEAEKRLEPLKSSFANNMDVFEMFAGLRLKQKAYAKLITESESAAGFGFSPVLWFNRAVAFEHLKQFDKLDKTLADLLLKLPDHAEALNFYGYSLADRGLRLDEALVMVNKALKVKPKDGYYLDSLAWVFFKQKKYKQALDIQLQAVEIVLDDPVMQEHLGDIYWHLSQQDKAKIHWQKAIDLDADAAAKIIQKINHGFM